MEVWHLFYVMQCVNYAIKGKQLYVPFINHPVKSLSYLTRMFDYVYFLLISNEMCFMFRLYLLAEGRVAYFGSRKKAEVFFSG
jgi:hypothetical protein